MAIKDILKHPIVYQTYQNLGGFYGARVRPWLHTRR
jgi:hypothetical protein